MPDRTEIQSLTVRGVKRTPASDVELIDAAFADLIQARPRAGAGIDLTLDRAAEAEDHPIPCTAGDVVELRLEGGLRIYTSVERLQQEIIPQEQARGVKPGELVIPRRILFPNQRSRGLDEVLVEAVELFDLKGKIVDKLAEQAGKGASKVIASWLEEKLVSTGGLFTIKQIQAAEEKSATAAPTPIDQESIDTSRPLLLFIHGTASRTHGSFSDLWSGGSDDVWSQLSEIYGDNILGACPRIESLLGNCSCIALLPTSM